MPENTQHPNLRGTVLTKLVRTCTACPAQWDAWDEEGTYYYVRYRRGWLSVSKGDVMGPDVHGENVDRMADGWMDAPEMLERTGLVLGEGVEEERENGW